MWRRTVPWRRSPGLVQPNHVFTQASFLQKDVVESWWPSQLLWKHCCCLQKSVTGENEKHWEDVNCVHSHPARSYVWQSQGNKTVFHTCLSPFDLWLEERNSSPFKAIGCFNEEDMDLLFLVFIFWNQSTNFRLCLGWLSFKPMFCIVLHFIFSFMVYWICACGYHSRVSAVPDP